MYVFVVMTTRFSENTAMTEIRGVFAHMVQAQQYANSIRGEQSLAARITKHEVTGFAPVREGVQTDPSVTADRALS